MDAFTISILSDTDRYGLLVVINLGDYHDTLFATSIRRRISAGVCGCFAQAESGTSHA